MAQRIAEYYPQRLNVRVPDMMSHSDVGDDGQVRVDFGAPVALDADGILAAQSIATASSTSTFASTYSSDAMGRYGRRVTVVASGAATSTVTIRGRDYLNQPVTETLTLNGTTSVNGVKAFKYIDQVSWGATASTTINVGWGNAFGLPFRMMTMERELVDNLATANAGTLTAGHGAATTQTATTADPRGLYVPHTSNAPNGTLTFSVIGLADKNQLHGAAHFYS